MDTVTLAGRPVRRLGLSLAALEVTGIWGEPGDRAAAVAAVARAVELGVDVLEVPFPFGPGADLVRDAGLGPGVFVAARLTSPVHDQRALRRLGRQPDLVLADTGVLATIRHWPLPVGAVVGPRSEPVGLEHLAAVRGPWPAPAGMVEWCEDQGIPYLAPSISVLSAGELTIALPAPRRATEVERVLGGGAATPPGAEPG
jgi:hypothetical protein